MNVLYRLHFMANIQLTVLCRIKLLLVGCGQEFVQHAKTAFIHAAGVEQQPEILP